MKSLHTFWNSADPIVFAGTLWSNTIAIFSLSQTLVATFSKVFIAGGDVPS